MAGCREDFETTGVGPWECVEGMIIYADIMLIDDCYEHHVEATRYLERAAWKSTDSFCIYSKRLVNGVRGSVAKCFIYPGNELIFIYTILSKFHSDSFNFHSKITFRPLVWVRKTKNK